MNNKKFSYNGVLVEIAPYKVIVDGGIKWAQKAIIITQESSSTTYSPILGKTLYDSEEEASKASAILAKRYLDNN